MGTPVQNVCGMVATHSPFVICSPFIHSTDERRTTRDRNNAPKLASTHFSEKIRAKAAPPVPHEAPASPHRGSLRLDFTSSPVSPLPRDRLSYAFLRPQEAAVGPAVSGGSSLPFLDGPPSQGLAEADSEGPESPRTRGDREMAGRPQGRPQAARPLWARASVLRPEGHAPRPAEAPRPRLRCAPHGLPAPPRARMTRSGRPWSPTPAAASGAAKRGSPPAASGQPASGQCDAQRRVSVLQPRHAACLAHPEAAPSFLHPRAWQDGPHSRCLLVLRDRLSSSIPSSSSRHLTVHEHTRSDPKCCPRVPPIPSFYLSQNYHEILDLFILKCQ